MTAKFISTVLKAASVVAVPLAMLAASTPASAQRPGQRSHSEWRFNNGRYDHWHPKKAHHKKEHYKKAHHKNKNYKNGYYRNGQYNNGRYGTVNRYPSRTAARYPSVPVIPGFPTPVTPNGRTGKVLPGTNPQYQQNNIHYRRY